ncbi:MAG: hypothetical protein A3F67_09930 [Verrucomicrobia bacterium RIFCSPHIGHO2_12_FULL_41_10]|nr:MAG: hypothetical protein A3F67_09930 [Verrucomicrobia bacterium RIFCSPHIGHO2_12_FULL_41_10]HLB34222.1 hypothetical protein [Chthoniobacterales bacterium]
MNKMNMHAMRVNGTRTPQLKDLRIFAERFGLDSLESIVDEVFASIERWPEWSEQAGCRGANIQKGKVWLEKALGFFVPMSS